MSTQVATGLPIVAMELQAATASPFTALTDSQWSYLAGSVTPLNPTISPDPYPMGRLRSCTVQRGKQQALNRFEAATLTAVLDNRDGKLDPNNASGPFYPFVRAESRIRVRAWYNRVLLGHALCNDTTPFGVAGATVTTVTSSPSPRLTNTTYAPFASLKCTGNGTNGNLIAITDVSSTNLTITPWDDSKGYPVVAGETVTAVASYRAGSTGRACQTSISFYTSAGVFVSSAPSGGVTDNASSWTDDSVTAVAPPGAGYATVGHGITAVANGEIHYISAIGFWGGGDTHLIQANMVPGQPATLGGAGKMAIDRFYGFLDGETLGYKLGYDATLTITATDAFKKFNSFDTRDYFALQAMGFGPAMYMRFDEPANTVFLSDISGSGFFGQIGAGVTTGVSPGTPPATVPMYSTSNNCVALNGTNTASIELINGSFVGQPLLTGSGPWTFMAFVKCPALPSNFWPIFSQGTNSSGTPLLRVQINSSGNLQVVYANGTVFAATPSSTNLCDGSWHFVVAEVQSSGLVTVYIDGGSALSASLGVSPAVSGGDFYIGIDSNGLSVAFSGDLDECAVFNSLLTATNVSALQSARSALRTNTAPVAISSLLTAVNWGLGFLDQTTSAYLIGPLVDINRTTLLDVLNNKITVTDYGAFFIRPDGQAEYLTGQFVAGNTTVVATFSDVNDSNYGWQNVPFDVIQRQEDEQLVYNDWVNTWNGDLEIPSPSQVIEISTPTSIATFGAQKQQQTLYSDTLGDAIKLTQWLNGHFSNPQTRFPLLEVNLKAWPGAAPQALARELMDYVTIVQTPMGLSSMTFHPLIIHIEDTIGADFTWTVRFILDALDAG